MWGKGVLVVAFAMAGASTLAAVEASSSTLKTHGMAPMPALSKSHSPAATGSRQTPAAGTPSLFPRSGKFLYTLPEGLKQKGSTVVGKSLQSVQHSGAEARPEAEDGGYLYKQIIGEMNAVIDTLPEAPVVSLIKTSGGEIALPLLEAGKVDWAKAVNIPGLLPPNVNWTSPSLAPYLDAMVRISVENRPQKGPDFHVPADAMHEFAFNYLTTLENSYPGMASKMFPDLLDEMNPASASATSDSAAAAEVAWHAPVGKEANAGKMKLFWSKIKGAVMAHRKNPSGPRPFTQLANLLHIHTTTTTATTTAPAAAAASSAAPPADPRAPLAAAAAPPPGNSIAAAANHIANGAANHHIAAAAPAPAPPRTTPDAHI